MYILIDKVFRRIIKRKQKLNFLKSNTQKLVETSNLPVKEEYLRNEINILLRRRSLIREFRNEFKKISINVSGGSYTIILGLIRNDPFYIAVNAILGEYFCKMGNDVILIINDNILSSEYKTMKPLPPVVQLKSNVSKQEFIKIKRVFLKLNKHVLKEQNAILDWLSVNSGIKIVKYSSIPNIEPYSEEMEKAFQNLSTGKISKNIEAVHRRYFGGRPFDPTNEYHLEFAKVCARNELINRKVGRYISYKYYPDLYLTLDGTLSFVAPVADVMRENGIPVLVYKPHGFQDRCLFISESVASLTSDDDWNEFRTRYLDADVIEKGKNYLQQRINLDNYVCNSVDEKYLSKISNHTSCGQKAVILLPNLTWDGALRERDTIFNGLDDWLLSTIRWAKTRKNILLIIREHPMACEMYDEYESVISMIEEIEPEVHLMSNILFIYGHEPVNTYYLVKHVCDVSIVYNGTMGLEIPFMEKPVIVCANSPYGRKGISHDPKNREEYFQMIENIDRKNNKIMDVKQKAATVAAYHMMYNAYYFPILWRETYRRNPQKNWQDWDKGYNIEDHYDLLRTINRFIRPLNLQLIYDRKKLKLNINKKTEKNKKREYWDILFSEVAQKEEELKLYKEKKDQVIKDIHDSLSWRITAPLRKLGKWLRK